MALYAADSGRKDNYAAATKRKARKLLGVFM